MTKGKGRTKELQELKRAKMKEIKESFQKALREGKVRKITVDRENEEKNII